MDNNWKSVFKKATRGIMLAFVKGGFCNADLKALNYVRKFLEAITLVDIATADDSRTSFQSYNIIEGNSLPLGIKEWPKTPKKRQNTCKFHYPLAICS